MSIARVSAAILAVGFTALCGNIASAQVYPNKPIRVVTTEPGSGSDLVVRMIAPGLTARLGQPVIVDNRGGAGGVVAAQTVAKALRDGYTLLIYGPTMWLAPFMRNPPPWEPLKDFSPVSLVGSSPNMLVVYPSLPASSVKELVALAKSKPGQLNYGSGSTGASSHLAAELFKSMAGVDIVRIPFKGTPSALIDLMGGQVQLMFPAAGAVMPLVKSGKVRALAVTSAKPSALAPGVPTVAASGLPGYESIVPFGIFAPVKTPAAVIDLLHNEIVQALGAGDVTNRLFNAGMEVVGSSPAQFTALIRSETARWGKIIRDAGIRDE